MKLRIFKILTLISYCSIMLIGEKIGAPLILVLIFELFNASFESIIALIGILGMILSIVRPLFIKDKDVILICLSLVAMIFPLIYQAYNSFYNESQINEKIFAITVAFFIGFASLMLIMALKKQREVINK